MNRIRIGTIDIYGCQEARERLEPYIDGQLTDHEQRRVHFHVVICRHCASVLRFESRLDKHIRHQLRENQIPSSVSMKIQAAIQSAQENGPSSGS